MKEEYKYFGFIPVSYTHLDVYKRQVLDCIQKRIDIREKGKVVYNGVDIDKFYPTDKKSEEKYILATGNLIALKGHDLSLIHI